MTVDTEASLTPETEANTTPEMEVKITPEIDAPDSKHSPECLLKRTCAWFHQVAATGLLGEKETASDEGVPRDTNALRALLLAHYGQNTLAIERTPLLLLLFREVTPYPLLTLSSSSLLSLH